MLYFYFLGWFIFSFYRLHIQCALGIPELLQFSAHLSQNNQAALILAVSSSVVLTLSGDTN